ncbi:MAG: hypothetical protein JST00_34920 [Deltaproteobacteria bacterium]|nr:hypothetical protein [Deltaproteobacteria bacterium]
MRVGFEALDVDVSTDERQAVCGAVKERTTSSVFAGVQDLRLRLRQVGGALLCVVIAGFAEGELVTSTAKGDSALGAVVGALDGLPERIDRMPRIQRPKNAMAAARHAAIREELKRALAQA